MESEYQDFFNSQSRPFRRDANVKLTFDEEGNSVVEPVEREIVTLSPEGSIDRVKVLRQWFYNCGCSPNWFLALLFQKVYDQHF